MKYIVFIVLYLFANFTFSQVIKFNKNYQDTSPVIRNIVVLDTGYVFVGGGGGPTSHLILTTDTLGNIKNTKKYKKQGYSLFHGWANSLKKVDNYSYILAGCQVQSGTNNYSVLLYKFNSFFDTIWTKTFMADSNYSFAQDCYYINNNYYLLGANYTGTNSTDFLLIKTDTSGNFIWKKNYGGYSFEEGLKVAINNSLKILLGGSTRSFYTSTQLQRDWYLVQTDTAGNQQWQNHYGHPDYDDMGINGLIATKDSGFLVSGNYVRNNISTNYNNFNGHIIKFNKDMGIEWDRQYIISESVEFKTIIELDNGNIAVVFMQKDVFPEFPQEQYLSGLMKLDANGNELWRKIYYPDNFDTSKTNFGILETVKQTPDGGFIMCGYSTKFGQQQEMWVVKTDSFGCDGYPPNCDTTNDIYNLQYEKNELYLFPNPAREFITITTQNSIQKTSIVIFDLFGKVVHEEFIDINTNYCKISIQNFTSGVYIVKFISSKFKANKMFLKY